MNNRNPRKHTAYNALGALQALENIKSALQQGDRRAARRWAERAVSLDPQCEDAWLYLAALASPRASLSYIQKALEINPASQRAQKGITWVLERLEKSSSPSFGLKQPSESKIGTDPTPATPSSRISYLEIGTKQASLLTLQPSHIPAKAERLLEQRPVTRKRNTAIPFIFWHAFGTLFFALIFLTASLLPFFPRGLADLPQNLMLVVDNVADLPLYFLEGSKLEPLTFEVTPIPPTEAAYQLPSSTKNLPSVTPYLPATSTPTTIPSPTPSPTPLPTDTPLPSPTPALSPSPLPSVIVATPSAVPSPQPTKKPKKKIAATTGPGLRPQNVTLSDRWVDVDLSSQQAFAMEGSQVKRSFMVSTGRWPTVTITGTYKIYVKYRKANMSGDDYFLPNVPYVMYFYKGYGLHGTYWHNNFGTPMSHGCVNLRPEDAAWLFDFASVGTIINVHP